MYVVNYDADNGRTSILSKFKNIPIVNDQVDDFYTKISKTQIAMTDTSAMTAFSQGMGLADDSFTSFLKNTDYSEKSLENYQKYLQSTTKATSTFGKSLKSLGANILSIGLNAGLMWGVSQAIGLVVTTITEMAQAQEKLKESAKELGSTLSDGASSIENYKKKISELYKTINDSSSSIEDVAQARVDLMSVQDELIAKFGTEKGAIENITEAINGQSDALDELSKKSYYQSKNQFNEKSNGEKVVDFISFGNTDDDRTQSKMNKMIQQMESSYYDLKTTGNDALDSLIAKSYGLNIVNDMYGDGQHFQLMGTLDEIQEKLSGIQDISSDFEVSAGFENSFTSISNEVDSSLKLFQNLYDQYILWEKVLNNAPDNQYDEQFNAINKAKEAYDNAFKSGDESNIKNASENFATTLSSAMNSAIENYDEDVANYFANMYPELQQQVGEWKFDANFEPNTDGLKDKVTNALTGLDGYSTEDITNFNPHVASKEQQDAYADLNNVALEYGLTIDQLISKLEKEKLVASEASQELQKKYGNKINELSDEDYVIATKVSDGAIESWDELIAKIKEYKVEQENLNSSPTLSISSTIDQLNTQLKPAFDSLKSAYNDIFTDDGFTLENVDLSMLDSMKSSLDDMGEKLNIDVDYSSFENLVQMLSDSSSTADEVQGAFNELATSVTQAGITGTEDIETLKSALESLGVVNNEIIAFNALTNSVESLREAGLDLADASNEQITAFVNETVSAEYAEQAISLLQYKKALLSETALDTTASVQNLISLAGQAGVTAEKIEMLQQLMQMIAQADMAMQVGNYHIVDSLTAQIDALKSKIQTDVVYEVDTDFSKGAKSASKSGKETADAYLDAYKKELSELDHIHNMNIISDREYYDRLNALNEKYFNDSAEHQKKYLDEYQSNQEKVYKGLQGLYKELLNEQKDGYDSALSAINKLFDGEIDKLNELKDTSKDSYQSQIDDIDKKIKRLEDERNSRKKSIQDQIDAIKEENEELDRQKTLEDALYEARRAENQKSRVYKNGQVEYDTDSKAISKAEDTVDKAKDDIKIAELEKQLDSLDDYYDNLISNLESQQDALKEKMDAVTESYESQIKQLEANQQKYSDIATAQEDSENRMMATALLGSNWQQLVLSGRLDVLDAFKGNYIGICNEISNADTTFGLDASTAAEGYAQSISDMIARTTSLETLLQSWKDLNTGLGGVIGVGGSSSNGSVMQGQNSNTGSEKTDTGKTNASSTNTNTITGAVQGGGEQIEDTLSNQWIPSWQNVGNNMDDICGGIVSSVNEMASSVVNSCRQAIEAINMMNNAKDSLSSSNATPSFSGSTYVGRRYANGTKNAKNGINLIGEDGYELYEDNKGNISLATEPTLVKMQGGEKVINHEETKNALKIPGTKSPKIDQEALKKLLDYWTESDENGMIKFKSLEKSLKPTALSEQINNISNLYNPSAMVMQNLMPKLPDYSNIATARSQEVNIHQDINVTIPNLDGEAAFHKFERGLDQMKLDALQRSYRR